MSAQCKTLMVHLTDRSTMGSDIHATPGITKLTLAEAVAYLNDDVRNAIVITGVTMEGEDDDESDGLPSWYVAVWRGGSESLDNFYFQALPLEEPDSNGGDLTAEDAVCQAADMMCWS